MPKPTRGEWWIASMILAMMLCMVVIYRDHAREISRLQAQDAHRQMVIEALSADMAASNRETEALYGDLRRHWYQVRYEAAESLDISF